MSSQKHETVFDLHTLLTQISQSFTTAALDLDRTFDEEQWKDKPFTYVMPKMHVSIRLELSHSNGKVKGLFRTKSTETREEVTSNLEIDVVSVPRTPRVPHDD